MDQMRIFSRTLTAFSLFALFILLGLIIDTRLRISYVSFHLGGERAQSWDEVETQFNSHFQVGMTRNQVVGSLKTIDPQIEAQIVPDHQIECHFECCEVLLIFRDRLGRSFGHVFCYDLSYRLLYVTVAS